MVVRRGLAMAALAGLLTAPSLAAAQAFTFEPSVAASAGYAATVLFTSKDPVKTLQDPFVTLAPAFGMTLETPRTINTLQAAAAGALPIPVIDTFKDARPSLTGNLTYTSRFELSELWTLE